MKKMICLFLTTLFCSMSLPQEGKAADERAASVASPKKEKGDLAITRINEAYGRHTETLERVDLQSLGKYKLASLYAGYLGIKEGDVPPFTHVSFDERLRFLYTLKFLYKRCDENGVCTEISDEALTDMPPLFEEYLKIDKKKTSLKGLVSIANAKVKKAKQSLDWRSICHHYDLGRERCELLKVLVRSLTGKDMVAYGMTEILPTALGDLNVTYLDLLLRHAGAEFVYRIPAISDEFTSLGFFQFTSFALRRDAERVEGASIINSFVKPGGEKIPDSVALLKGEQQHVAALYFATHNLARLVWSLSKAGVGYISKSHGKYKDELVMHIAASHHAPTIARAATVIWINEGMRGRFSSLFKGGRVYMYVIKTRENLNALNRFL